MRNRVGIFFTYFQGEYLKDFPEALTAIRERDNIYYYNACYESTERLYYLAPLPQELFFKVHPPEMVQRVKLASDYKSALYSSRWHGASG